MTRTISKEPTSCAAPPFWEIPEWSHFQENLARHHQFTGTKLGPLLSVKLWYLKVLSHLIRFECELNSHSPDAHRMRIESTSISFTLLTFWRATPTAAQATISTLTLLSQHSRCIETHKFLVAVADYVKCEFRRSTRDHSVSDLFFDSK